MDNIEQKIKLPESVCDKCGGARIVGDGEPCPKCSNYKEHYPYLSAEEIFDKMHAERNIKVNNTVNDKTNDKTHSQPESSVDYIEGGQSDFDDAGVKLFIDKLREQVRLLSADNAFFLTQLYDAGILVKNPTPLHHPGTQLLAEIVTKNARIVELEQRDRLGELGSQYLKKDQLKAEKERDDLAASITIYEQELKAERDNANRKDAEIDKLKQLKAAAEKPLADEPEYPLGVPSTAIEDYAHWMARMQSWGREANRKLEYVRAANIQNLNELTQQNSIIVQKNVEIVNLQERIARYESGDFTAEEIHNFCHKLSQVVSRAEFEQGCKDYQDRLYPTTPPNKLKELL